MDIRQSVCETSGTGNGVAEGPLQAFPGNKRWGSLELNPGQQNDKRQGLR
jgi:hypothetical protein